MNRRETPDILAAVMDDQNQAIPLSYDYSAMPGATASAAKRAARQIKQRMRRAIEDVIFIGGELAEIKMRLPRGHWLPWIETEFDLSERSAQNFMRVSREYGGKSAIIADLKPTTAYALLASPEARTEIDAMPEPPTNEQAKSIIAKHKPATAPPLEGEIVPPQPDAAPRTQRGKCKICNRPLTDGASIANGIGPCCAARVARDAAIGEARANGATIPNAPATPQAPASQAEPGGAVAVVLAVEVAEWLRGALGALLDTPRRAAVMAALDKALGGGPDRAVEVVEPIPACIWDWGDGWNDDDRAEYDGLGDSWEADSITRPRVLMRLCEENDADFRPALWKRYEELVGV